MEIISFSKAAIAGGYAVGAILAGLVAAIIALAGSAGSVGPAIQRHDEEMRKGAALLATTDSAQLRELRIQTCILISETAHEKRDCLKP